MVIEGRGEGAADRFSGSSTQGIHTYSDASKTSRRSPCTFSPHIQKRKRRECTFNEEVETSRRCLLATSLRVLKHTHTQKRDTTTTTATALQTREPFEATAYATAVVAAELCPAPPSLPPSPLPPAAFPPMLPPPAEARSVSIFSRKLNCWFARRR